MMGLFDTHRESCGKCLKQIYIGQSSIICSNCNVIFHLNCVKDAITFRQDIYCSSCIDKFDIIRYNPFFNYQQLDTDDDRFYDNEPSDYIDIIENMSNILENCKCFSVNDMNSKLSRTPISTTDRLDRFSTYFYNLDGNKSNFDEFAASLRCLKHTFSVICLAETNTDPCNKGIYKLDDYDSCYQIRANRLRIKVKGVVLHYTFIIHLVIQSYPVYQCAQTVLNHCL